LRDFYWRCGKTASEWPQFKTGTARYRPRAKVTGGRKRSFGLIPKADVNDPIDRPSVSKRFHDMKGLDAALARHLQPTADM
jgi:hypothetical protein